MASRLTAPPTLRNQPPSVASKANTRGPTRGEAAQTSPAPQADTAVAELTARAATLEIDIMRLRAEGAVLEEGAMKEPCGAVVSEEDALALALKEIILTEDKGTCFAFV